MKHLLHYRKICAVFALIAVIGMSTSISHATDITTSYSIVGAVDNLTSSINVQSSVDKAVQFALIAQLGYAPAQGILVKVNQNVGNWAFGTVAFKESADPDASPNSFLFIAFYNSITWKASVQFTSLFQLWLKQIPSQLINQSEKTLLDIGGISPQGDGSAQLSLPFLTGETWTLTGGPHSNSGNNPSHSNPWMALDLQSQDTPLPHHGYVRAAYSGIVTLPCAGTQGNYIQIDHANGWQTGYFHIAQASIIVSENQFVNRGQILGQISAESASNVPTCHGTARGTHVHFTLRKNGSGIDWEGKDIGGWTAHDGAVEYQGCLTRISDNMNSCQWGSIYNDGTVGSGGIIGGTDCSNYSFTGVVLFRDAQCKSDSGSPAQFSGAGFYNLTDVGFNDLTKSIYNPSGWSVRIWSDANRGGPTRCVTGSMWDLSVDKYDDGTPIVSGSSATISSVEVFNNGSCTPIAPNPQLKLYDQPNFQGNVVYQGGLGFSNAPSANSFSMDMPAGWSAMTWRGDDRTGLSACWSAPVHNFQDFSDWQNKIQSIEVFDHDVCLHPPIAPSNLQVSQSTTDSITFTWQNNAVDQTGFSIYRWNGSDYVQLQSVGSDVRQYTDSGFNVRYRLSV